MELRYWSQYGYIEANSICESNHYAEIFSECIEDVIQNKTRYTNKPLYTGWSYEINSYTLNKNNTGIKIYVCIKKLDNKEDGYILRTKSDKACIYISNKLDDLNIGSALQHEFIHIIKLYERKHRNGIETVKETLYDERKVYETEFNITFDHISDEDQRIKVKNIYFKILDSILYMFTENEQLATINAACKQIDVMDKKEIHDVLLSCIHNTIESKDDVVYWCGESAFNKRAQVTNMTKYIHDIHLLYSLIKIENSYKSLPYCLQLLIAYYLNKHRYIKPRLKYITYDIVFNAVHNPEPKYISPNIKTEINNVYNNIKRIVEKYQNNLLDGIYAIMEKKDLFLPINEVCNIAPAHIKRIFESMPLRYED